MQVSDIVCTCKFVQENNRSSVEFVPGRWLVLLLCLARIGLSSLLPKIWDRRPFVDVHLLVAGLPDQPFWACFLDHGLDTVSPLLVPFALLSRARQGLRYSTYTGAFFRPLPRLKLV